MRKLFKERKLFKGGNYMRKYGKLDNLLFLKFTHGRVIEQTWHDHLASKKV